ncbi:peptide ABC transporter substrate-binding protein [Nordella sp. HKS 07]|uniref:peptide ABC transporter substrate-binding protein n=1 Tax=Nordella sp. HKS 07 TaxID=2712222 RepID=UPI0013E1FBC3|nr:peptide ABC transporter substrate-binding protein [Nordella sp. HKS 07]QIG49367.1 peptide ABC transporter substrate-binding protein [Nordella sp. HKS 07]
MRKLIGLLCLVALSFLTASGNEPAGAGAPDKGILRLLLWQAPTSLNPHFADGVKDQTASRIVYEPLASFDREGNLVPFLAADIPSLENGGVTPDGKSVTWKLKQGVKWSDGAPFTSKDVVFTFQYLSNPEVKADTRESYRLVERVEALDDYTVKVTFKNANPTWALPFVGVKGMIIPEHIFSPYNNSGAADAPVNLQPVGTGPYRMTEFRTEDVLLIGEDVVNTVKIIFEPNEFYRDKEKLAFKQIILQGGGDATLSARAVLKEGAVDYGWNLQVDDKTLTQLESGGTGKVMPLFGSYVERIAFNFTDPNKATETGERSSIKFPHPILGDRKVREALTYAIDREKIAALYGRTGRPTSNILMAPSKFISRNTSFSFDLKKAADLLDKAGWIDSDGNGVRDKDGVELSLLYQTSINPVRQATQDIVQAALESIGVHVEKKIIEASIYLGSQNTSTNTRRHFYADLEEYAYGNKTPDPGAYMAGWICGEAAQEQNGWSGANNSRYCNPDYDALYERTIGEIDPERRQLMFIEMNDMLYADAAVIPLVHWADTSGISNDLEGYDPTPWDSETWNIANWHRRQ